MEKVTAEAKRLAEYRSKKSNWKHWGPYVSDRQWGTVREDYSEGGSAWDFFPHDHARSRAYRWGEDGIGGISDRNQYLCFSFAFWNGNDEILKERFFGVTAQEGNHGEDVKEYYYYLDSTPTHSYMKMLYKYPVARYPYAELVSQSRARSRAEKEYELMDSGVFDNQRYFDCFIEYAKSSAEDILIRLRVINRSSKEAELHLLPTIWFRNTWSWGYPNGPMNDVPTKPELSLEKKSSGQSTIEAKHPVLGSYYLYAKANSVSLFTNNETNATRLFGLPNESPYVKDAFHRYVIENDKNAVNNAAKGTKACFYEKVKLAPQEEQTFCYRLTSEKKERAFDDFDKRFEERVTEADKFYSSLQSNKLSADEKLIQRQSWGGMLWSKQLYYYDVEQWLKGDPHGSSPSPARGYGRNRDWLHLTNFDIISMPDKWEFPWYAAWDLAFHCIVLAQIDADFAKRQLELMTREWYMHPNGQLPAYEWAFGDVNPPVHAWAAWRVYKIDAKLHGTPDHGFLEGMFHKLLLNFTWWVNRKDADGMNIFQGGFLGLDNIGVFDRSAPLPTGGRIDQADGTSWMAAYCLWMLKIALELARTNPVYQDTAFKFLEHFLRVANAMTNMGGSGQGLWDEEDGFFYDVLHRPDNSSVPLKVRSLVGLIPLFAVDTIEPEILAELPDFKRRMKWFFSNRPHLSGNIARMDRESAGRRRLAAIMTKDRLLRVLTKMFDEREFLSEYGIRSLSKIHDERPYRLRVGEAEYVVKYEPGESTNDFFGGNSNWRGPIWIPINFLLIESLQKFHHYYGDDFKVEYPTGSGVQLTLAEVATDLSRRLSKLFLKNEQGRRPVFGDQKLIQDDENWNDCLFFPEYFNAETGQGCGASHQTGWTGLVSKLLQQSGGGKWWWEVL